MEAASDSEDERILQPSDDEVLRDEQAVEDLLHPQTRGINRLWTSTKADPNEPRVLNPSIHAPEQPSQSRRIQRARRRRRRRRRRHGQDDDEAGPIYEREELVSSSSDIGSDTSLEVFSEKTLTRRLGRRRVGIAMILVALAVLLLALVFGTYQASTRDAALHRPAALRSNGSSLFAPTTILVSLDGFRADFLDREMTPTLHRFIEQGVSPKYMLPSFPSLTFPNHWTMVTGMHPESHGVVGNSFWDPQLQEEFWYTDPSRSMDPKWWTSTGAEPLWATAERQGIRSAVHMWPGSEAGIEPAPTYLDKFNGKELLADKVRTVLSHLDRPSEFDEDVVVANEQARPRFISFYVPNVDAAGHRWGPNSTEMREAITGVDSMLQHLFAGIEARNLTDIVNLIVVSDHGMATTSIDRLYQLDDMLDVDDIEHIDGWPLYGLRPKPSVNLQQLYLSLKESTASDPHLQVYLRQDMPERWHFSRSDRIAPLWLIPEAGWAIVKREDFDIQAARQAGAEYQLHGLHGYDNQHPLMRAIFIARGPAFPHPPNSQVAVFQNTEIYNIVCDSLGVSGRQNNGTLRLPLHTVGLHGEDGEPPQTAEPAPPPSATADSDQQQEPEDGESEQQSGAPGFFGNLWHGLKETVETTWDKVTSWFDGGGSKR